MDTGTALSILAAASGVTGGVTAWLHTRKRDIVTDGNDRYTDLQEDLANERLARQAQNAEHRQQLAEMRAEVMELRAQVANAMQAGRAKDDYIAQLRQHISLGKQPPPPPWPVALGKES